MRISPSEYMFQQIYSSNWKEARKLFKGIPSQILALENQIITLKQTCKIQQSLIKYYKAKIHVLENKELENENTILTD